MSVWLVQVVLIGLFVLTCGALAAAWKRGRLGVAAIVLLVVAVAFWIFAFIVIATGFRAANDFATCDPQCGAIQYVTAIGFVAPPLFIALAALAMLVARGSRWRSRRTAGEGSA